jgi:hypothetical protein
MFGMVATIVRHIRRVREARRREARPAHSSTSGVYDPWLDA